MRVSPLCRIHVSCSRLLFTSPEPPPSDPAPGDKRILRIDAETDELHAICTGIPYCFVIVPVTMAVRDGTESRTAQPCRWDHAAPRGQVSARDSARDARPGLRWLRLSASCRISV